MTLQAFKNIIVLKMKNLSKESTEKGFFANALARVLNRIKFETKTRYGIVLVVEHVVVFAERLSVSGWALSRGGPEGIQHIEVYLNNSLLGHAAYGDARDDVEKTYPFVKNSRSSGFHFYADMPEMFDVNKHTLLIKVIGIDGRSCKTGQTLKNDYHEWMIRNEPDKAELERQTQTRFPYEPLISLVTPTYNTPVPVLSDMIESVLQQTYSNWELCIADGGSQERHLKDILKTYTKKDTRIKAKFLPENRGITGNSNAALCLASGDFIGLLDHDDTVAPFALFELVKSINANMEGDYFYSDEDRLSEDGTVRYGPLFKPDWSPDTLRSTNYPSHFSVFRKALVEEIWGFREEFDGCQNYDLLLRATEKARKIVHIPKILYHWRTYNNSLVWDTISKGCISQTARKALQEHLARIGLFGYVEETELSGYYKVTYILKEKPRVSIIIPNRDHADDLERCVNSILKRSSYQNVEVVIVENGSREKKTFTVYVSLKSHPWVRIIEWNQAFNYSAVNNFAVKHAFGQILLFLNNDTQVINANWLERMLEYAVRKDVGGVGAKLYYPDGMIQHAGVIVGLRTLAGHCFKMFSGEHSGYMGRLKIVQNLSAVTGACLMMRKEIFQEVAGFDERYQLAFNDIDLCLKIREKGYLVVWTPHAELYHYESKTRRNDGNPEKQARFTQEQELFRQKWKVVLEQGDPYYNPNLTLAHEDFSIKSS